MFASLNNEPNVTTRALRPARIDHIAPSLRDCTASDRTVALRSSDDGVPPTVVPVPNRRAYSAAPDTSRRDWRPGGGCPNSRRRSRTIAGFTVLVWLPAVIAAPTNRLQWTGFVISGFIAAAAWVVAASLSRASLPSPVEAPRTTSFSQLAEPRRDATASFDA
jgi:hypothetical protein